MNGGFSPLEGFMNEADYKGYAFQLGSNCNNVLIVPAV